MLIDPWTGTHDDKPEWDHPLIISLAAALFGAFITAAPVVAWIWRQLR